MRTRDLAGRYQLERILGRGGMSIVWSAMDRETGRMVAVKVLSDEHGKSRDRRRRMRIEAAVQMKIRHAHVLPVYDAGETEETAYLVMPIADGGSCEHHLEVFGRMEQRTAARVMVDALDGLSAVHAQHVVHRDMKPSNLLMSREGHVWLSDFGVVAVESEATFAGTEAYVAPELRVKGALVDERADQFGSAATLFHLAAGVRPRPTLRSTEELPETAALAPQLWTFIKRGLASQPTERFPDVKTMRVALQQCMEHLPTPARDAAPLGSAGVGSSRGRTSSSGSSSKR